MPRVLFGWRPDWRRRLERHIDKGEYRYDFARPDGLDPAGWDCVVPLCLDDYAALARWPDLQGRKFLIPDPDLVALCDDKLAFNRHVLAGPFAQLIPPLADGADPAMPSILKKRRGEFGADSVVIGGPPGPEVRARLADPDYFRQVLVAGNEEFALHLLIVEGAVVFNRTVRHRMPGPLSVKGAATRPIASEMLADSPLLPALAPLMADLGYNGTCCIDYKLGPGGRPMVFEVNPRIGLSLLDDINSYLEALLFALRGARPKRERMPARLANRVAYGARWLRQRSARRRAGSRRPIADDRMTQ
jgi:hypothetical protein